MQSHISKTDHRMWLSLALCSLSIVSSASGQTCVGVNEPEFARLPCPGGYVSKIFFASYGLPTPCPDPQIQDCHAANSQAIVESLCLNQLGGCSVRAENDVFGDPCFLQGKRLVIIYDCTSIVGEPICVETQENDWGQLTLECSEGTVISSIDFASYGNPQPCPNPTAGPCHAESSRSVMETACLGQQRCTVLPSNDVFGDPCTGVLKRLVVSYTCQGAVQVQTTGWGEIKTLFR